MPERRVLECLVDGCCVPAAPGAPVALCERHLAAASDWSSREHGVTDLLPSPCRVCGSRLGVHWVSGWTCAVCEWRHGEIVDGELPPPRVDVVYYLRFDDRIKIGTTANPRQRLAAIWHDEVLAFERGDRTLEQRRHAQFAEERFERTEWFRLTPRLRAHVDTVAAGGSDPWALHARWTSEALALRG
ncbi:GIY-YIG nuclease family protein [Microbacterium sp. P06]|uniref:GIY-YIG nuclease family protein n=1 Tax=Microbacterium sp. P06 TaxID=3366949 RepID=UPI0037462F58